MSHLVLFIIGFVAGATAYYVAVTPTAQTKIAAAWAALVAKFRRKK